MIRSIKGYIYIPKGLKSDPRFIVPDEIVEIVCKNLSLHTDNKIGIDPMCGVGTIPRVINSLGGECHGIEIDTYQHSVAVKELGNKANILLGDCKKLQTPKYDYLYTSVPFGWFNKTQPSKQLALTFKKMLKPGSPLIIDSSHLAEREGETWNLAEAQIKYFEKHGFKLKKTYEFETQKQGICDDNFVELEFIVP